MLLMCGKLWPLYFLFKEEDGFRIYTWWIVRFCDRGSPFGEWHIVWNVYLWYTLFSLCFLDIPGYPWHKTCCGNKSHPAPRGTADTEGLLPGNWATMMFANHLWQVSKGWVWSTRGPWNSLRNSGELPISFCDVLVRIPCVLHCWIMVTPIVFFGALLLEFHGCWQIVGLNYRWW